jgi:hypothetical protein
MRWLGREKNREESFYEYTSVRDRLVGKESRERGGSETHCR